MNIGVDAGFASGGVMAALWDVGFEELRLCRWSEGRELDY